MKLLVLSIFCFCYCRANSQNILIQFHYTKQDNIPDKFNPELRQGYQDPISARKNIICPAEIISFKIAGNERVSTVRYKIGYSGIYNIANGFCGADIFLTPGDTDIIHVASLAGKKEYIYFTDSIPNYLSYIYHHSGVNSYEHQFFDSLVFLSGAINSTNITFKQCGHDINTFFLKATKEYNRRKSFFDEYITRHIVSSNFIYLANAEIKAAYIFNLLTPCINNASLNIFSELPQSYKDSVKAFNINDSDAFFHTYWQSQAAELYNNVILSKMDYDQFYSNGQLLLRFKNITLNFSPKIRDELLTSLLLDFIQNHQVIPDSLMARYTSLCSVKKYKDLIFALNNTEKDRMAIDQNKAVLTKLINAKGKIISLNDLRDSIPIIFDCWASWCKPCLEQFSFQKKIDSVFNGKIKFVYLSFDKNLAAWQNKSNQLGLKESYDIQGSFSSDFAKFLKINAIPRYFFLNNENEFIPITGVRPSNTTKFIEKIKSLL